jgi:hypothetical protein
VKAQSKKIRGNPRIFLFETIQLLLIAAEVIMKYIKLAKPAFEMYKLKVVTSLDLAVRYNICFSFGFRISVNKPDICIAGINF